MIGSYPLIRSDNVFDILLCKQCDDLSSEQLFISNYHSITICEIAGIYAI